MNLVENRLPRIFFCFLFFVFFTPVLHAEAVLEPLQESSAYARYLKRPKSELSKLILLLDRFKGTAFHILYEGVDYDSRKASVEAKKYLARNYERGDDAEEWIKRHCYRSQHGGDIILLRYPDGKTRPLRDVMLEELEILRSLE